MAKVGTAHLNIVPKVVPTGGISDSVERYLSGIDTEGMGRKAGARYSSGVAVGTKGLAKSGAVIGAFGAVTNAAMSAVSSSVGAAASRLDTLNNYPKVMQALGYSAQDAQTSLSTMDQHLRGLPTSLSDMVSSVQGIAAVTGDLGQATDAGLAMNDMLLAAGANTQLASSATEQFRQMLSQGKPDMQDWRSLVSAMPGQMDQLAKSMLGPTANSNDLYQALGGGGHEATVSMDQLMDAMVRLDKEGGEGFTSFASQARSASGGVQASVENMRTAVVRGVADVAKGIGTDTIQRVSKDVGSAAEGMLKTVGDALASHHDDMSRFLDGVESAVSEHKGDLENAATAAVRALEGFGNGAAAVWRQVSPLASAIGSGLSSALDGLSRSAYGLGPALASAASGMAAMKAAQVVFSGISSGIGAVRSAVGHVNALRDAVAGLKGAKADADGVGSALATVADGAKQAGSAASQVASGAKAAGSALQSASSGATQTAQALMTVTGGADGVVIKLERVASGSQATASALASLPKAASGAGSAVKEVASGSEAAGAAAQAASSGVGALGASATGTAAKAAKGASAMGKLARVGTLVSAAAGPASVALTVAGVAAGYIATQAAQAKQRQDELSSATDGLRGAMSSLGQPTQSAAGALSQTGSAASGTAKSLDEVRQEVDDALGAASRMSEQIGQTNAQANDAMGKVDSFRNVIDQMGTSGVAGSENVARLKEAVKGFNEQCGTNYQVEEETGKVVDQNGAVVDLKKGVDDLADAKKRLIEIEALQKDTSEMEKNLGQAAAARTDAQNIYNDALERETKIRDMRVKADIANGEDEATAFAEETAQMNKDMQPYQEALDQANGSYEQMVESMRDSQAESDVLNESMTANASQFSKSVADNLSTITGALEAHGQGFAGFEDRLRALGLSDEQLGSITKEQWAQISSAYDGSSQSIIDALGGIMEANGTALTDQQRNAAAYADSVAGLKDAFARLSDEDKGALSKLGVPLSDLAAKMAQAGISAQDFGDVGAESFASLYQSAKGNMDNVKAAIDEANELQIDPKEVVFKDDGSIDQVATKTKYLQDMHIPDKAFHVNDDGTVELLGTKVDWLDAKHLAEKGFHVTDEGTIETEDGKVIDLDARTVNGKHFDVSDDGTVSIEGQAVGNLSDMGVLDKLFQASDQGTVASESGEVAGLDAQGVSDKGFGVSDYGTAAQAAGEVSAVDAEYIGDKDFSVNAQDNASGTIDNILGKLGGLVSGAWTAVVNVVTNGGDGHATGGIRLHAAGGVRPHAHGAIATRAVPLDVVGEAGAEAIVPLTNERYSKPFAETIARQMRESEPSDAAVVVAWLADNLPGIISDYTPVMGRRDFDRMARRANA